MFGRSARAADLLDDVYLDVFSKLRVGDTERHAHSRVIAECLERGCNWAHGILRADSNHIPYAGESDVVFQAGDLMQTDYVAYLDGYPGHQSRNVIFGEPTAEQMGKYNSVRDIYRATIDRCRPGAVVAEIYDATLAAFKADGWKFESLLIGHGVGAWWHQQEPYIVSTGQHVLEEGMVLATEPHVDYWHLQDMFLITKDGPRLLSPRFSTDEMLVVG